MAKDVGDLIGTVIGRAAREAMESISSNGHKDSHGLFSGGIGDLLSKAKAENPLTGARGVAAGAGLATAVPLAVKGVSKLRGNGSGSGPVEKAKEKVRGDMKDGAKDAVKDKLPGGNKGQPGVGKGRRMPIQQAVDVAVPLDTAYEQWTQYEEWPNFMHRITDVSQEDDENVSFKTKIWGKTKEFKAEIVDERPGERIKWEVTEGVSHTGVVTFHELAERLTRIEVNIDVQPGSLIEKAARGMRHVKRAVRADLARFKAYTVMQAEGDEESSTSRAASASSDSSRSASGSGGESSRSASGSGGGSSRSASGSGGGSSRSASGSGGRSRSRAKSSGGGRSRSGSSSSGGGRTRSASSSSGGGRTRSASSSSRRSSNGSSSNKARAASNGKSSGSGKSKSTPSSSGSGRAKSRSGS